ncbi:XkdX family protein [Bacillus sp. JJ722]
MIDWFPSIKEYYELGFYNNENMKLFVKVKYITAEQYKEITGIEYVE